MQKDDLEVGASGSKEAFEFLVQQGESKVIVVQADIFESDQEIHKVVSAPGLPAAIHKFTKREIPCNHKIYTLEGLLSYINSDRCKKENRNGVVFIGKHEIVCDLAYQEDVSRIVRLPLDHSEEFMALVAISSFRGPKELWRLLTLRLSGCIPGELYTQIREVDVKASKSENIKIDCTGVTSGESSNRYTVKMADGVSEIRVDWDYKGRIFECFSEVSEIELRLELDLRSDGLKIALHPRDLERVLRESRLAMVAEISSQLPEHFEAFEGEYQGD